MKQILLLWDVDGTLATSASAGLRALRAALQNAFNVTDTLENLPWAGRTDISTFRAILIRNQLPDTPENTSRYAEAYLASLSEEAANPDNQPLPGISEILRQAAAAPDIHQALLTGNLRQGARTKLSPLKLWQYFPIGAFADDSEDRNKIAETALARARQAAAPGEILPGNTFVIGDTPHDIACARHINARAIVVATGIHTPEELAAHNPDHLFENLSDTQSFWQTIQKFSDPKM